jgi:beta-lactamase regulating signal transducer with metallopeptidase domain
MIHEALPWIFSIGKYILASAALLLFYRGLFRKNSTYNESRAFLLSIAICAALVSQFHIAVTTPKAKIIEVYSAPCQVFAANNSIAPKNTAVASERKTARVEVSENTHLLSMNRLIATLEQSIGLILIWVYLLVACILGLNLLLQYQGILKLKRKGRSVFKENLRLVIHPAVTSPFSFGKTIFLPENLKENQLEVILEHESWHIRHKHYVDVLIQEISTCLFWFNPIQWLIRKDLRSIHEFQADRSVLDKGCDLFRYQTIILEEVMGNHIRLANGFNQSFTKKRFIQMKNQEPSKLSAIRKLMLVPFLTLLFASFCFVQGQSQVIKVEKKTTKTGSDGKTETVTVTTVDTVKMSMTKDLSGYQSQKVLDSISTLTKRVLPILKKLEKTDLIKNPEALDELFEAMNIKVNNKAITHDNISKEVVSSLKPEDFMEMDKFMVSAQENIKNNLSELQGQTNASQKASQDFMKQFGKLGIVQKMMPEFLKILNSMMASMTQGGTQTSNGLLFSDSGRLLNGRLQGNVSPTISTYKTESTPEPVPVYINPYCKLSDELFEWSKEPFGSERLVSIERKSNETIVTLSIPIYLDQWIRFSNKFQLVNKKNGDRYTIRRVENMPLNTEIFFHDVDHRMVLAKVIFPPLKKNVKIIDIVDTSDSDEYDSEWSLTDVQLSDYKPGANKVAAGSGAKVYY